MSKIIIYDNLEVFRNIPKNLLVKDSDLFEHEYFRKIDYSYIKVINNPLIVNHSIFDIKNFKLHLNETYFEDHTKYHLLKSSIKNMIRAEIKKEYLPKGLWIVDSKSENFGHWLIDAMCRLLLVPKKYNNYPVLLPKSFNINWLKETLDFLDRKYIFLDTNKKYQVGNLVLTSKAHPTGNYNPLVVQKFRNLHQKSNKFTSEKSNFRRIWASREHVSRTVSNFDQIKKILEKYNFEIIPTDILSLSEKIKMFSETEVLSGTHGSGLINMMYMPEGTKVFEVRDLNDDLKNSVFSLASALNIDYFYTERSQSLINGGRIDEELFESKLTECITSFN
jgi:capsular polysaccharide biosynthesis protein